MLTWNDEHGRGTPTSSRPVGRRPAPPVPPEEPLGAARGIMIGVAVSLLVWAILWYGWVTWT